MDGVEDIKRDIAYWQQRTALDQAFAVTKAALILLCNEKGEDIQVWLDKAEYLKSPQT